MTQAGAELVLPVRNPVKGDAAVSRIRSAVPSAVVSIRELDLASLDSVGALARPWSTPTSPRRCWLHRRAGHRELREAPAALCDRRPAHLIFPGGPSVLQWSSPSLIRGDPVRLPAVWRRRLLQGEYCAEAMVDLGESRPANRTDLLRDIVRIDGVERIEEYDTRD